MTTKFEANKTYATQSICDSNCIFSYDIIRRTAKTVWVKVHGEVVARKLTLDDEGSECFFPLGKYSMSPMIRASRLA